MAKPNKASLKGTHLNQASDIPLNNLKMGLPGGSRVKNLPANTGDEVQSVSWKDPLEKEMETRSNYSCLEKSHGQKSLVG